MLNVHYGRFTHNIMRPYAKRPAPILHHPYTYTLVCGVHLKVKHVVHDVKYVTEI